MDFRLLQYRIIRFFKVKYMIISWYMKEKHKQDNLVPECHGLFSVSVVPDHGPVRHVKCREDWLLPGGVSTRQAQHRQCPYQPAHKSTTSEHCRQSWVLVTGLINNPRYGKGMNQAQGPSRESGQEKWRQTWTKATLWVQSLSSHSSHRDLRSTQETRVQGSSTAQGP